MITDDIGIWSSLGVIQPQRKQWLKLPVTATGGNNTFRLFCECSDWSKLAAYLLVRSRYTTSNTDQVGLPIRISPSPIPVIFELRMPEELLERSVYFRDLEIYRVNTARLNYMGTNINASLQIRIEELWG